MLVSAGNGVQVTSGASTLFLDPKRATPDSVVTHAHSDHLPADAHSRTRSGASSPQALDDRRSRMTPPTLDFLKVRKPKRSGIALPYGKDAEVAGMRVRLHDAGHIFGSAMAQVVTPDASLVYTGDFSTRSSFTAGEARPIACDVLVTESTYGDPRFDLPPKDLVLESLEAWMLQRLLRGPVALGAYPLGRAQELVFLANRAGLVPIVSPDIAALTGVYNAHGHDLRFAVLGSERALALEGGRALHIVPREWLKKDHAFAQGHRARGGQAAYLSGWCHRYSYFTKFAIDAQFALSDHASFSELVEFALACKPKRVLTMHGSAAVLAHELRQRGLQAEALR